MPVRSTICFGLFAWTIFAKLSVAVNVVGLDIEASARRHGHVGDRGQREWLRVRDSGITAEASGSFGSEAVGPYGTERPPVLHHLPCLCAIA